MKKKKGFTLIELIIAMAILAIAMTGFSMAIESSSTMVKNDTTKMDNLSYEKYILQTLKAKGRISLKNYYEPILLTKSKTPSDTVAYECYFYFDDDSTDDLKTSINSFSFTEGNLDDMKNSWTIFGKKNYGAYLKFNTCKYLGNSGVTAVNLDGSMDNVRVEVSIINFKVKNQNPTAAVLYIGR